VEAVVSAAAVAATLLILCGCVVWGCIVDHLRHHHYSRDADALERQRALLREIRRHTIHQHRSSHDDT
jgi:hypothetical protein